MTNPTRYRSMIAASLSTLAMCACAGQGASDSDATAAAAATSSEGAALTACPGNSLVSGIDISYPQGAFDLAPHKANGDSFVYIGATYGITVQQWTYPGDVQRAKALGMIHGPYHFFVPSDDPNAQADNFLKVIGSADPKGDLPPALDWEITNGVSWDEAFARAKIFLDRVEQATGRTPVIYTYSDFFGQSPPQEFAKYPLWISNTGDGDGPTCPPIPAPWDKWLFYQFNTSGGLDKDRFNGTLDDLKAFAGDSSAPAPSAPPATPVCQTVKAGSEPVLSGCNADAINAIAPASAKAFLDRAYNWIDERVPYSETETTDGYRRDCSGYVSYVWQLADHPGDTTYSLAGGPWNNDESVRITWGELTAGDAINFPGDYQAGTGHVELWGGWLNKEHTEYCSMEEFDYGNPASFRTHSIYEYWAEAGAYADVDAIFLPIRKAGYVPSTTTCEALAAPLDQVENNGGLTALTWSDGHIELFARTKSGHAVHTWTEGSTDDWHQAEDFSGAAECGVAAVMSYAGDEHAELFDPDSKGRTQSLDFQNGWTSFKDFGGQGVTELSTLRWSDTKAGGFEDGRTELFGLDSDHHLYHRYYDPQTKAWSSWASLGGELATGASAILNQSGDGVLFALDKDGQAWTNESDHANGGGWKGWKAMGGKLSSRPVVVREGGGSLQVFARGMDGKLYGAHSVSDGFSSFAAINDGFQIAGAPAAAIDDGSVTVFVRGLSGRLNVTTLDTKTHRFSTFHERSDGDFASDPFAWQRPDGRAEVFAVTTQGHLTASYHSKTGWTSWKRLATGVDACPAAELEPECPNGDGLYCGGHGIGGIDGTLYSCKAGKSTLAQSCSAGCAESGKGGNDVCNLPSACETSSDCKGSMGQCAICIVTAQVCGDSGDEANFCSTNQDDALGLACTSNAQCDPCGTGQMVCGACAAVSGTCGGNCCQFAN